VSIIKQKKLPGAAFFVLLSGDDFGYV